MSVQKKISPFQGMCPPDPEWGKNTSSFLTVDGTELELLWEKAGDGMFKSSTPYGMFFLELHPFASGVKILSRWERNNRISPERVCFSPLVFRNCKTDHAFFCGEKMGRCLAEEFRIFHVRFFIHFLD